MKKILICIMVTVLFSAMDIMAQETVQKAVSENLVYVLGKERRNNIPSKVQLSGKITDLQTGKPFEDIAILTEKDSLLGITDSEGRYSFRIPYGRQSIQLKGIGIKETRRRLAIYENSQLDIGLEEAVYSLEGVSITSDKLDRNKGTLAQSERLQIKDIRKIPVAFGEVDVIKAVMMLPGVNSTGEASSGVNVRGGSTEQNLILLNGGTIYNPTHLFGILSAFNPDVVQGIDLYKNEIPVKYGGRISSVLDISSKEGSREKFSGSAGIGLLTSRLCLETPVGNSTSLLVGGRTSYSDWMLGLLPKESGYSNGSASFYDLNATLGHTFNMYDKILINGYFSRDRFNFDASERYSYQNMDVSMKWRHVFNEQLTANITGAYDNFSFRTGDKSNPIEAYSMEYGINQAAGRLDLMWYKNEYHTLELGGGAVFYTLNPGEYLPDAPESLVIPDKVQQEKALESSLYIGDNWKVTPKLSINAGIRYTVFNALGKRTYYIYEPDYPPAIPNAKEMITKKNGSIVKTYHAPDLRLSAHYIIKEDLLLTAGLNTMRQYIHKLSNTTVISPFDTWKLSDANILPQSGIQLSAGINKSLQNNTLEASIEGYYRAMNNYLDYRSGAQLTMNHHIETDVARTRGRSYGVEFMIKKPSGKLTGQLNYVYSRTELRWNSTEVKPLNGGSFYPADYDKPHALKVTGNYRFTHRYSFSFNCDYSTGRPITLPSSQYIYWGGLQTYYSDRNAYRIPDYFRMDIAFLIEPSHHLTALTHSSISIGAYNITGRKNVYSVYYTVEDNELKCYQMSVLGSIIPYISYNIKF